VERWGGAQPSGFPTAAQTPQKLTWSEPIEMEIPNCDGNSSEMKKLIAREYNKSPAAEGDQICSQNIEIVKVKQRGQNARVSFRVNDGVFPPDPQERGILKWIILGGIGAAVVYKIRQSRRRRGAR